MADKKNTIGRFEIIEKIGEGPIGAVYKALDPVIRRTVAIKVIKLYALEETTSFAEVFEKIYRVVRTSTALNHPNICIIYDLSEEKKIPYITMEFVEGQDLDSLLQKKHQFKRAQLLNILSQVCDALDFAHKKGVIHQDLKTTNILVTPEMQVKITDFGIAGLDEIAAAQTKKLLSIPFYISPEQALGEKVTTYSDLFSLGVVVYQLLSGELPFRGNNAASVIMTIAKEQPSVPKDVEKSGINRSDWDQFFATALAKNPDKRFQSAGDLFEALNGIVPPSDHSYFPYSFSGSENDKTGEFEKTFVGEAAASPTVLIDANQLFRSMEQEQKPPVSAEPEPLEEVPTIAATAPEEVTSAEITSTELSASPTQPPVAAEVASDMPEVEEIDESAQTMLASSPQAVSEQTPDQRKDSTLAPATQLIEMPAELREEAVAKSNGSGGSQATILTRPAEMEPESVPNPEPEIEPQQQHVPESSRPTVLIQGTGAMVDSQPPQPIEPVSRQPQPPPQPRMVRPQPPKAQAPPRVAPQKAAGPPNLKRYLIAAIIVALFIFAVGGAILLRGHRPETVAQNAEPSSTKHTNRVTTKEPAASRQLENSNNSNPSNPVVTVNGKINITSDPPGAKVLINGEDKGVTPLQLTSIPAGQYNLQLQLNGYKDVQQVVEINQQNQMPNVQATMEKAGPLSGTLMVESTPPNAFIVISNRVIGVTPKTLQNWKVGKYNITLKKDGYQDYSGSVRVNQDKTAVLRAQLAEIPKPPPPVEETKKQEPPVEPGMLVTLGPGVTPPKTVKRTFAKYPEAAKARKIEGTVSLSVLVSENGQVLDVRVLQSPSKILEESAVNNVKTWVYQPATKEGVPVKVWIPVTIAFQVSNQ